MEPGKKSFMLYYDYREHLELLTDEERGRLLMALMDYGERGELPDLDGAARMAFSFIRAQMDRDAAKYAQKCAKNADNGAKGGRPRKATQESKEKPSETEESQTELSETQRFLGITENSERFSEKPKKTERLFEKPRKPDTDTDTETDTETDNYTPPHPSDEGSDAAMRSRMQERFDEFWAAYPKRVGKAYAFKAWKRIKPTAELHERIMQALADQKRGEQWLRDNGRYIPNPATWLNGGYWDNEEMTNHASNRPDTGRADPPDAERNWTRGFKPAYDDDPSGR